MGTSSAMCVENESFEIKPELNKETLKILLEVALKLLFLCNFHDTFEFCNRYYSYN